MRTADRAPLADVALLLWVAEHVTVPLPDDDPFVGLPGLEDGATPIALSRATEDGELTGALDAAVAFELISPQRRRELLALLEPPDADELVALAVDPVVRAELLTELEALLPGVARGGEHRPRVLFGELVHALSGLGALTHDEEAAWSVRAYGEDDGAWAPVGKADARPRTGLLAVLPGPSPWHDGFHVLSVECHENSVRVHWEHVQPMAGDEPPHRHGADVWIADDAGTAYIGAGGRSSGCRNADGEWLTSGCDAVRPGLPAAARSLTVSIGRARVVFDVTGVGERAAT